MKEIIKIEILKRITMIYEFIKDIITIKEINKRSIEKIIIIVEIINCLFSNYLKLRQLKAVKKNKKQEVKDYQTDLLLYSIFKSITFSIITILIFYNNIFDIFFEICKIYFNSFSENVFNIIFILILINFRALIDIPFKIVSQFGIESIHGFNNSTIFLFIKDLFKSLTITNFLLAIFFYVIMVLLSFKNFAIFIFIFMFLFQIIILILVPTFILPLFNKFSDLENNELRLEIEELAHKTNFPLTKIQVMNQSIRSSKCNAFFTGIGNKKMIVFFDTLLKKINKNEPIIAILAHEIGHWSYSHLYKSFILLSISQFIMLISFQIFYNNNFINILYKNNKIIKILHFYFLYEIFSIINTIITNIITRRHEIEADKFAVEMKLGSSLKEGLNLLLESNKSSEFDDWLYSYINYSHPTVNERNNFIDKQSELLSKKNE